jgi:hypothetical protein
MRKPKQMFIGLVSILFLSNGYAATFYRHLPFNLTISSQDNVVVDYDFSENNGITCTTPKPVEITFQYKGNRKTARLPVHLISDHVPNRAGEELADVSGQFDLTPVINQREDEQYELSCGFIGS